MKTQIKGQSIRIRLSESDVAELTNNGQCEDTTWLPNGEWKRVLRLTDETPGFQQEENAFFFLISQQDFLTFFTHLPRRDGFTTLFASANDEAVELIVEIDVRNKK